MLRDLLSGWCTGRLAARRFALLWAVVVAALILLLFLTIAWATTMVMVFNSDGTTRPAVWGGAALFGSFFLLLAALFNIVVKRGRDIGIPGFVSGVGFIVLFAMGGVTAFATILLALVPSGAFSSARTEFES